MPRSALIWGRFAASVNVAEASGASLMDVGRIYFKEGAYTSHSEFYNAAALCADHRERSIAPAAWPLQHSPCNKAPAA